MRTGNAIAVVSFDRTQRQEVHHYWLERREGQIRSEGACWGSDIDLLTTAENSEAQQETHYSFPGSTLKHMTCPEDLVEYVGDLLDALYGESWAREGRAVSLPELERRTCGIFAKAVFDEADSYQFNSREQLPLRVRVSLHGMLPLLKDMICNLG